MSKISKVRKRQKLAIVQIGDHLHSTLMMASEHYAEGNVMLAYMMAKSIWRPTVFVLHRRGLDGAAKGANAFSATNGIRSLKAGNGLTPDRIAKLKKANTTVAVGYECQEDVANVIDCSLFLLHFGNDKVAQRRRKAARVSSHLPKRKWWQLRRRFAA